MDELSRYVDQLFSEYRKIGRTEDLKAEILGNLQAKKEDLISSGLDESEAVQKAEESITSVDFLIDGNKRVYYNRMKLEFLQWSLIVLLVGWILTIPLLMFHMGSPANVILFLAVAGTGAYYLALYLKQARNEAWKDKTKFISMIRYRKIKRIVWILWAVFALVSLLATTALRFGSSLWFARKIRIDGPYAFADLLVAYLVPMLTAVIPIIAGIPARLALKYEAGESNEK